VIGLNPLVGLLLVFVGSFVWGVLAALREATFENAKRQGRALEEQGYVPQRFQWRWHHLTARFWIRIPDGRVGYFKVGPR
jgi:hypothetical protein